MSLISDALNEAQREANKRRKDPQPALLGDNPLLTPPSVVVAPPYRPWTRIVIVGSIVVIALTSAVATGIIRYRQVKAESEVARRDSVMISTPAPAPPTAITRTAAPPTDTTHKVTSAPRVVEAPRVAPRPNPPPDVSRPALTAPARREEAVAPQPAASSTPTSSRRLAVSNVPSTPSKSDVAPTQTQTPAPVPVPVPVRQQPASPPPSARAPQQDMRVIVDPTVLRSGDSLFIRAYTEHTRGNLDGAADLYERALTKPPVSPELYNDYGALLATRGKHAAAIAMYNLGIATNDKDARLWANLGDSYRATGRRADAMSAYFEAVKLDPANIGVRLRLAAEYASLGDTASARRGFDEAVRSAPNDPEAHYRYGAFLQSQRDVGGAIRELQTFVDLAPGKYPSDVIERTKAYIATLRRAR